MSRLRCLVPILVILLLGSVFACGLDIRASADTFPDLYEASVEDLQSGLEAGHFTSVDLVKVNRSS